MEGFLYLRPLQSKQNAYDMKIVPRSHINNDDYYTLSKTGVSHVVDGHIEHWSIRAFEREFALFHKMIRLPFFERYPIWKAFNFWRTNVKARKAKICKQNLERNLFLLDPILKDSLYTVRSLTARGQQLSLFATEPGVTYKLNEFRSRQRQQNSIVRNALEECERNVLQNISQACNLSLLDFLASSGFKAGTNNAEDGEINADFDSLDQLSTSSNIREATSARSSMNGREITFTERAAMRTQCRKLARFIRLIDMYIIDTFLEIALYSTETFLGFVEAQPEDFEPLFEVDIKFDLKPRPRLRLVPFADDFKASLDAVVFDGLKIVMNPTRLLTHSDLSLYVQPHIDESGPVGNGLDVEAMILQDDDFRIALEDININVGLAFKAAIDASVYFNPFKEQFLENDFRLQGMTMKAYYDTSIENWGNLLDEYQVMSERFGAIPQESDVGVVRINSTDFRNMLLPSPAKCLQSIRQLIPKIAGDKTVHLLEIMGHANEVLSKVPVSVKDFVDQIEFLAKINAQLYDLDEATYFVSRLHHLMEDEGINDALGESQEEAELHTNYVLLSQTNTALKTSIASVEESMAVNTKKFTKMLGLQIPQIHDDIFKARGALEHFMISNTVAEPRNVLSWLESADETIEAIADQCRRTQSHQKTLGLNITQFDDLEEVLSDLHIKQKLWRAFRDWRMMTTSWLESPFSKLDVDEIEKQVHSFYKVALQAERQLLRQPCCNRAEISLFLLSS